MVPGHKTYSLRSINTPYWRIPKRIFKLKFLCDHFLFQDQVIKNVDKRVYQYLQTRCQLLLKSYPTTLEEDSAELHEAGKDDLSQKKYLCLVLRSKEKKMLHGAVKYCEKQTSS